MSDQDPLEDAVQAVGDALDVAMDHPEFGFKELAAFQKFYFKLEFMRLARDPGLKYADFAPSDGTINRNGEYVDFGGVKAPDPTNPFLDHAVTIDHIVGGEGDVRVSINGLPVGEVGKKRGSHIR